MARFHAPHLLIIAFAAAALLAPAQACALASPARPAAPAPILVRLHSSIAVTGPRVTLGDLFEGIGGKAAATPFAAAPAPGGIENFSVRSVMQAATAAGFDWQPDPELRMVSVTRAARFVPVKTVQAALKQALSPLTGQSDDLVQIAGRSPQLAVAINAATSVTVENLQYDPTSHEFTALLAAPAGDPAARRVPVQGRIVQAVEVPVPITRIDPGQIIHRADLRWIALPLDRVDRNTVTDAQALIGKAARHALEQGQPIRGRAVERPSLVQRGQMVTVSLETPYMSLSTIGKAMQSGGQGDLISVLNTQSHKTIVGIVIGPNRVAIRNTRVEAASLR